MHPNKVIVVFDRWIGRCDVYTNRKTALDTIISDYRKGSDDHKAICEFLEDEQIKTISLISHTVFESPFHQ